MISTIWKEAYIEAYNLPAYCYLIGNCGARIPVRVKCGARSGTVIVIPIDSRHGVVYNANHIFHVLVPESWEEAKWDISLDLMERGAL
jgi:hypothetical protein